MCCALLALTLVLAGCGRETDADGETALADSALVPVLTDLHLADARAYTTGESTDSLRRVALARHGLDSSAFADRLQAALGSAEEIAATYGAVVETLSSTSIDTSLSPQPRLP